MQTSVRKFSGWGLAAAAFGLLAATQVMPSPAVSVAQAGLIDTDTMDDTFVQLNDVAHPDKDTFTIRGRVVGNRIERCLVGVELNAELERRTREAEDVDARFK